MAGTFAEARAQILSLQPAVLRAKSTQLRNLGTESTAAGTALSTSAREVGAQRGTPYAAYRDRLAPTGGWLTRLAGPATATAGALDTSAGAGERAQMVLAQQEEALARYGSNPAVTPAQFAAAMAQALTTLNAAITEVTGSYEAIAPPEPGVAPVVVAPGAPSAGGPGNGSPTGPGSGLQTTRGAEGGGAGGGASVPGSRGDEQSLASGVGVTVGPQAGPFAGFVQDPISGNLIDPGTGREVEPGGRFLDPITGLPFGDPSQFASRLEGLVGGVPVGAAGIGGAGGGVLGLTAPAGIGVGGVGAGGVAAGGLGAGGFGAGGVAAGGVAPFLAPGLIGGAGAGIAARGAGGAGRFAGLYGGTLPPSLVGNNPANSQLLQAAAANMETKAGVAQRYAAIASGQAQSGMGFMPPPMMGGGGGGAPGGARSGRTGGSRAGGESPGMWGAPPATGTGKPERRRSTGSSTDVEDADVWTGGGRLGSDILDGRR